MERIKERLKKYIHKVCISFNKMEMRILPGNVAFFLVLALIPVITLIAILASYFSISLNALINLINHILPDEAGKIIIEAISGKGITTSMGTFNIMALIIASNGTYAIISASNTLYDIKNTDSLKDRVKSVVLLLITLFLIIFLLLVPVFGGIILSWFKSTKFITQVRLLYDLLKWPITFFLIFATLKLVYTMAPSTKIKSSSTTYGALFTTFCWTIATAVFSYYLHYFANYNIIYGNISNIIILMMWMYIMSYVFVLGMAINAVNLNEKNK